MDVKTQQLNIMMEAIRQIVRVKTCPPWVVGKLTDAVKKAKTLTEGNSSGTENFSEYEVDYTCRPFNLNERAISTIENDTCLYEIIGICDPINGINLYNVKIVKGNKNNPTGYIVYNVPETKLQHIKE